MIVDNCCMQLVMRPQQFDVFLLENLYGDIVSDLCAGRVGGLGLVPGANLGDCTIFEAVHGSAPDIAGKGLANPTAMMLSAVLMLRHLGQDPVADRVEKAIHRVYQDGPHLTRDVGGSAPPPAPFIDAPPVPGFSVSCRGHHIRVRVIANNNRAMLGSLIPQMALGLFRLSRLQDSFCI